MAFAETSEGSQVCRDKRYRAGALRTASVADTGVAEEYAQWRNPELKSIIDANQASVVEGVDAAISARVADERNRASG